MSNKSIDGLQRRSGSNKTNKAAVSMTRASKTVNNENRTLGLDHKKAPKRKVVPVKEEKRDKLVTEYLSEIQDINPTNLVEVPQKKKSKKRTKKKHKVLKRVVIAVVILLVLAGGGAFLYLNNCTLCSLLILL